MAGIVTHIFQYKKAPEPEPTITLNRVVSNYNTNTTDTTDSFGQSVGIAGGLAIVGAPLENVGSYDNAGTAYIIDTSTGNNSSTLTEPVPYIGWNFARSVSTDETNFIAGSALSAFQENGNTGHAYVYNSSGSLLYTLTNPDTTNDRFSDAFGYSVALSGNKAVVSSPYEELNPVGGNSQGKVYIYDITTQTISHTLVYPGVTSDDSLAYGISVDAHGDKAIVGTSTLHNFHDVHVYDMTTGNIIQTITPPSGSGRFGDCVRIFNNYAIAGSYDTNKAYIFDVTTGNLLHTLSETAHWEFSSDKYGYSVAINDTYAVVGCTQYDGNVNNGGIVYVYKVSDGSLVGSIAGTVDSGQFGFSVDIDSSNNIIIGQPFGGGATHIYTIV